MRATTFVCLATTVCMTAAAAFQSATAGPTDTVVVDLMSQSNNVTLNGPLQVPLGQIVDIAVSKASLDATGTLELTVQSVDGQLLDEPIALAAEWLEPESKTELQTSTVRLQGYQSGEFEGAPASITETSPEFHFKPVFVITRQLDTIGPAEKRQINELIDQLALEVDDTFLEQSNRYVKRESSIRIENAIDELTEFGRAAWPILTTRFSDPRPAIVVQPTNSGHTVGVVCIEVIRRQIIDVPEGYPAERTRTIRDGGVQLSPRLLWGFHPSLKDWLDARKDETLQNIQADVLESLIAEEDRLGYPNEDLKDEIRTPLVEHLNQLRRSIQASR